MFCFFIFIKFSTEITWLDIFNDIFILFRTFWYLILRLFSSPLKVIPQENWEHLNSNKRSSGRNTVETFWCIRTSLSYLIKNVWSMRFTVETISQFYYYILFFLFYFILRRIKSPSFIFFFTWYNFILFLGLFDCLFIYLGKILESIFDPLLLSRFSWNFAYIYISDETIWYFIQF